jgi:hypothetical protein
VTGRQSLEWHTGRQSPEWHTGPAVSRPGGARAVSPRSGARAVGACHRDSRFARLLLVRVVNPCAGGWRALSSGRLRVVIGPPACALVESARRVRFVSSVRQTPTRAFRARSALCLVVSWMERGTREHFVPLPTRARASD